MGFAFNLVGICVDSVCIVPLFMIFLVSKITPIVHIKMKAISEVELGSSFFHATELYCHQCISKGKEIRLFLSVKAIAFKELLMLMNSSSIYHGQIIPFWNFT